MATHNALRPHQSALIAAGVASLVLWAIPVARLVMLPLTYLNTHLHELCHALVATGLGGRVSEIVVNSDGSGVTMNAMPVGSSIWPVASAGYVGAALIGGAIIAFAKTPKAARQALWAISAILALALLIWVRGDWVGWLSGAFWVVALGLMARNLKGNALLFAAQFIGLQQCLNAFQSIYTLLQISAATDGMSDARIMEQASGIPAIVWALSWAAFSLVMVGLAFRLAWRRGGSPVPDR